MVKEDKKEEKEITKEVKKSPKDKKIQNYLATIILLGGLLLGSVFVDVAQLIQGQGISQKRLQDKDLFEYNERTWVAFDEPTIPLTIINDKDCEECGTENAILGLKAAIPTLVPTEIDMTSNKGKELLSKIDVKMIPAFIFTKQIEESDVYERIKNILTQKDDMYILDASMIGIQGKYVETPPFDSQDKSVLGNPNAKAKIIVFSDFQCPYSKLFYQSLDTVAKDAKYKDNIQVTFKHLPLSFHQRAEDAANATECADDQGKFWEMYNTLFQKQEEWGEDENNAKFKLYAAGLGLDAAKFNSCIDEKKFQSEIDGDKKLAQEYNISGTPAIFINDQFVNGAISADDLKSKIDAALAK